MRKLSLWLVPIVLLLASIMFLAIPGCTFVKALSFSGDTATSYKREGSKAKLEVYAQTSPENCVNGPPQEGVRALPVALATGLVTVALNLAESEIDSYLAAKQKQFTANYGANLNKPFYYTRDRDKYLQPSFDCVRLIRYIKEGDRDNALAFRWVGSLEPTASGSGLTVKTRELLLRRAAALTDEKTRKVDITVEIKIDVTTENDKGQITTANVGDKTLLYQGVQTPGQTSTEPAPIEEALQVSSSWFPAIPRGQKEIDRCNSLGAEECKGVSAVNVAVQVTETGSGGDAFGTALKQFDDNKATLNTMVKDLVSGALTPTTGGGSSKSK
jgi:hypothetical protein